MLFIPAPCVADAVGVVVMYDLAISVIISELLKDSWELFDTANEGVEPSMTVSGVVLGLEDSADNKKHSIY